MTKLIGIKELQTNTKGIREQVEKGVSFIVVYRSRPIFEIKPLPVDMDFHEDLKAENVYNSTFLARMKEAQSDIKNGKVKKYTTKEFINSL
ncbi:MAG: hypothetical protein Q8P62_00935 [Candidatus Peregrinibacteria bacterium]|nr:hypothetical protein [Candidatus Peregrinibacteria bacterium]